MWPHTKTATTESSQQESEPPRRLNFRLSGFWQIAQTVFTASGDTASIAIELDRILSGLENVFSLYSGGKKGNQKTKINFSSEMIQILKHYYKIDNFNLCGRNISTKDSPTSCLDCELGW